MRQYGHLPYSTSFEEMKIKKIVSGGQTGVDQAALDAAITVSMQYGGWLPSGRRTEAGPLPDRYRMQVLDSAGYPERTRKNVMDSDATLILSHGSLHGGSALTAKIAQQLNKPLLHADLRKLGQSEAIDCIRKWLHLYAISVLNVAGPRASSDHSIYKTAFALVVKLLRYSD